MIRVGPEGPPDARLVCIGESLGPNEERLERPFIGRSGHALMEGISFGGLQRGQVLLTNLCKYKPPNMEDSKEKDRWLFDRRDEDIAELEEEMKGYSPTTICLIGKHAVRAFLGICGPESSDEYEITNIHHPRMTPGIQEYHGSTFTRVEALALQVWARDKGIDTVQGIPESVKSIVVTLHPAFALHGMPRFLMSIKSTIRTAALFSQKKGSPPRPPISHFNLYATVNEMAEHLQQHRDIPTAIDIETLRADFRKIIIFGAGTVRTKVMVASWDDPYAALMRGRFATPGETVGHNFLFDLRSFAAHSVRPSRRHRIFDTIVACARLQPVDDEVRDFPWLSLAACSARYDPGFWFWKETDRSCQRALFKANWIAPAGVDERDFYERLYNGIDVYRTSNLEMLVKLRLQREGM